MFYSSARKSQKKGSKDGRREIDTHHKRWPCQVPGEQQSRDINIGDVPSLQEVFICRPKWWSVRGKASVNGWGQRKCHWFLLFGTMSSCSYMWFIHILIAVVISSCTLLYISNHWRLFTQSISVTSATNETQMFTFMWWRPQTFGYLARTSLIWPTMSSKTNKQKSIKGTLLMNLELNDYNKSLVLINLNTEVSIYGGMVE